MRKSLSPARESHIVDLLVQFAVVWYLCHWFQNNFPLFTPENIDGLWCNTHAHTQRRQNRMNNVMLSSTQEIVQKPGSLHKVLQGLLSFMKQAEVG